MSPFAKLLIVAVSCLMAACVTTSYKQNTVYLLKFEKGDTVAMIARKYDTTAESIFEMNGLKPGVAPKIGQVLRVQPGPAGLVAGAQPAGRVPGGRLARKLDPKSLDQGVQFTDEDIPSDDGRSAKSKPKKGGLLFNGGNDGASNTRAFFHWPVQGPLGSGFGMRHGRPHKGIDIRARYGTEILASAPGVVSFSGVQNGFGRVVMIRHGQWTTVYAHLSAIDVETGQAVDRMSVLGQVGASGNAHGPHLHFEIRSPKLGSVDPLTLLGGNRLLSRN